MRTPALFLLLLLIGVAAPPLVAVIDSLTDVDAQQAPAANPRQQPGATVTMYAPDQRRSNVDEIKNTDNYEMHFMVTQGIRDRKTFQGVVSAAQQAEAGGRSEPGDTAARLLHPQSADEPEEHAESGSVRTLLRNGSDLEVAP